MPNTMDHERMRFNTMSLGQLYTRLHKITDGGKLLNFMECCDEYMRFHPNKTTGKQNYSDLCQAAIERYKELFGANPIVPINQSVPVKWEEAPSYPIASYPIGSPAEISKTFNKDEILIKKSKDGNLGIKEKKSEPSKPVDIADVIYTKRKLRLE